MQLGAKRAVDARATLLLGRGWCKTQNAHEARPRPSFRGQKAVSHVVWTQIPSTVLPPGQMAKCENCDSVHWQRQQSSVQVREPETGVEKVKRKWLQRTGPQVISARQEQWRVFSHFKTTMGRRSSVFAVCFKACRFKSKGLAQAAKVRGAHCIYVSSNADLGLFLRACALKPFSLAFLTPVSDSRTWTEDC